jgi:hypothetical protein
MIDGGVPAHIKVDEGSCRGGRGRRLGEDQMGG